MTVSHKLLLSIAALIWFTGGLFLLFKGYDLIAGAYTVRQNIPAPAAFLLAGLLLGIIKAVFIFNKSSIENIERIRKLDRPEVWQFYKPGLQVFLIIIIPSGIMLSKFSSGTFYPALSVGAVDISIGTALIISGFQYFKKRGTRRVP